VMTDDMLPEYSYITTVHDVPTSERVLSAGAVGSVVMVYPEHRAYLVEFEAPWHVLSLGHDTVVPHDELSAELAATHERMTLTGADRRQRTARLHRLGDAGRTMDR
jgi:hypothetical protein